MCFRKTQGMKQLKGKVPKMVKFEVLGNTLERQHQNPTTKIDEKYCKKKKIEPKVANVQEFTISEKKLQQKVNKWKSFFALGIDEVLDW